jgi:hypothetical protein
LSNTTPRFFTEDAGDIEISEDIERHTSFNFTSCWGVPNNINSVLDGFNAKKLADIHDDID